MKEKIEEILTRGVSEVIEYDHLKKRLESGEKLRIKLGIDPTSPNIHVGRAVVLLKLRDFQMLGHQIVLIVGDFTGQIGDTSDKEAERPMLSAKDVSANMKSYVEQAAKILDITSAEVHYNSKWLAPLTYAEIGTQADTFSLAEFIARDNIKKRLDEGKRISLRELLYPLMQGYDSVMVKADVELGGTDQRFNMLAGRSLQPQYGQTPQDIVMSNLILGTDGRKMSSSWGNTINLTDDPNEMYGKVMSIPDQLIIPYFIHATRVPLSDVRSLEQSLAGGENPRDAKMNLARELVQMYHSLEASQSAEDYFVSVFQKKQQPTDMPEICVAKKEWPIVDLLLEAGFAASKSEARRLLDQKGITINNQIISLDAVLCIPKEGLILQKGKRYFVRISGR